MLRYLKLFRNSFLRFIFGYDFYNHKDLESLHKISKIINQLNGYYPYTSSALSPRLLEIVMNDIIINNRKKIVEIGSGISTIVISKLIKTNLIDCQFYSIEENAAWMSVLKSHLEKEDLNKYCHLVNIPVKLKNNEYEFDEKIMSNFILNLGDIDMLIIDGPIAANKTKDIRRHILPRFIKSLGDKYSIYLDDTNRKSEIVTIKEWESKYGLKFLNFGTFSIYIKGQHYNIY